MIINSRILRAVVALSLVCCLMFTCTTIAHAEETIHNNVYHGDISNAMLPATAEMFEDGFVTGLDVANMLYELDCQHRDVEKESLYAVNARQWMKENVGLPGYFIEQFDFTSPCAKQDLALMLYSYAEYRNLRIESTSMFHLSVFSDFKQIDFRNRKAVAWAIENNMIVSEDRYASIDLVGHIADCSSKVINPNAYLTNVQFTILASKYALYLSTTPTHGDEVVEFARQYLGYDYIWGGQTTRGFDCSGFIYYVFSNLGYDIGQRTNANGYSDYIGQDITKQCKGEDGNIDWDVVPVGSVISFDWDWNGKADHIGIWTGEHLLHAKGSKTQQYAVNGWMVCENEMTENDIAHICSIKSFDDLRIS